MSYIITYDLNKSGQNYNKLEETIKAYGAWAKIATTTFIIVTTESSEQIRNKLRATIDSNDKLFVAKLSGEAAWNGITQKIGEWLRNNIAL